jgi:peptidoglycan/LPS O-acetylase OafA/YrhL
VAETVRPLGRVPALDGVRGLAIALIIAYHATGGGPRSPLPGGFVSVDVFFVLSGFLITSLLISEWCEAGSVSLKSFYARRALRLFPALAVFLAVVLADGLVHHGFTRAATIRFVAASAGYVANFAAAFNVQMAYVHTWLLSAEEQFYLVWPVTLVLLVRCGLRRNIVVVMTAALLCASALLRVGLLLAGGPLGTRTALFFDPLTHADPILLGCLLGEVYVWGLARPSRVYAVFGAAAFPILGYLALTLHVERDPLYIWGLPLVCASALERSSLGLRSKVDPCLGYSASPLPWRSDGSHMRPTSGIHSFRSWALK